MEIDRNRLRLDLENYFGTAQILMSSRQITILTQDLIKYFYKIKRFYTSFYFA